MKRIQTIVAVVGVVTIGLSVASISADDKKKPSEKATQKQAPKKRRILVADLDKSIELVGLTGKPLGEYLTIDAIYVTRSKGFGDWLRVTAIDGVKVKSPFEIHWQKVHGDGKLPVEGKAYRLRGYESGGYLGLPPDHNKEEGLAMQAYGFHFMSHFNSCKWKAIDS